MVVKSKGWVSSVPKKPKKNQVSGWLRIVMINCPEWSCYRCIASTFGFGKNVIHLQCSFGGGRQGTTDQSSCSIPIVLRRSYMLYDPPKNVYSLSSMVLIFAWYKQCPDRSIDPATCNSFRQFWAGLLLFEPHENFRFIGLVLEGY